MSEIEFTDEQKQILTHDPEKHARVLAGPGTGKSFTIINYIGRLSAKYSGKSAKLLTFTRAANAELLNKIKEVGQEERIYSSTIHSFALSILLNNPGTSGLPEPIRIADQWEWDNPIKPDLAGKLSTTNTVVDKLKIEMSAQWQSLNPEEKSAKV